MLKDNSHSRKTRTFSQTFSKLLGKIDIQCKTPLAPDLVLLGIDCKYSLDNPHKQSLEGVGHRHRGNDLFSSGRKNITFLKDIIVIDYYSNFQHYIYTMMVNSYPIIT